MSRLSHIDSSHAATQTSILIMLAAQAAFTANDTCVKLVMETMPLGQTLVLRNGAALVYLAVYGCFFGGLGWPRAVPMRAFSWRLVGEIGSTILFFVALTRMPIADLTAIGQITPLAITAAGALFLGEPVGWRRWLAALVGFVGVLLIIQPGGNAFTWAAVLGLVSYLFGVLRDLATRAIGPAFSTLMLAMTSVGALQMTGLALAPFETWHWPGAGEVALLLFGAALLALAYALLIASMRTGDLATVSPFRYSAVLWALIAGYVLWNELPNLAASIGIVVVIAAGLYALRRQKPLQAVTPSHM